MAPTPLLFLIADTGGGHRASAQAVASHLAASRPGEYECAIVDPFADASPWVIGRTADLYEPIVRRAPWFWGALYHSTNSPRAVTLLRLAALRAVEPGITRLLQSLHPAAVVSFHPLLNHIAARAMASHPHGQVPFLTVITDLVDVHASWTCPSVDAIVAPSQPAMARCLSAGIPPERCFQLGLPVDPRFATGVPDGAARRVLRRTLGIDEDRFAVLLCGGAVGSGRLVHRARALAAAGLDIELVVICGRNGAALRSLAGLRDVRGRPVHVHGFVDTMPAWLRAVDLLVTKAGPGAIVEALCSGVPLVLSSFLPGQEAGNVGWAEATGVGLFRPGVGELVDTVRSLAADGATSLAAMRAAVRREARPGATAAIAELITDRAGQRP